MLEHLGSKFEWSSISFQLLRMQIEAHALIDEGLRFVTIFFEPVLLQLEC
jgi:hypothetical protein